MPKYKITYRTFGETRKWDNEQKKDVKHVDPANFVDVTLYTDDVDELVKDDGGVDMKALKGHIRKEIGDTFYQFVSITRVGETI